MFALWKAVVGTYRGARIIGIVFRADPPRGHLLRPDNRQIVAGLHVCWFDDYRRSRVVFFDAATPCNRRGSRARI